MSACLDSELCHSLLDIVLENLREHRVTWTTTDGLMQVHVWRFLLAKVDDLSLLVDVLLHAIEDLAWVFGTLQVDFDNLTLCTTIRVYVFIRLLQVE